MVEIAAGLDHAPQWPRRVYEAAIDRILAEARYRWSPKRDGGVVGFVVARLVPPEAELERLSQPLRIGATGCATGFSRQCRLSLRRRGCAK